jgi:hypothetical protein
MNEKIMKRIKIKILSISSAASYSFEIAGVSLP